MPAGKLVSAARYAMVHLASRPLDLIVVNEFPKSGGTWLGQMLSRALRVPFPRNRIPTPKRCIMHGHYLSGWGMKNVVALFRDGRDVMVSWYYHCLFPIESELGDAKRSLVSQVRRHLAFTDVRDVKANLPKFIEYSFTEPVYPRFSWADFVDRWWQAENVVPATYEGLKRNGEQELRRIAYELVGEDLSESGAREVLEAFSFVRQTGRRPGQEQTSSFLRKGIVGDWKNFFSAEAREIFAHFAEPQLEQLGYESDPGWVEEPEAGQPSPLGGG